MKKWIVVVIIILILMINPTKSSFFNKSSIDSKNTKVLNQINVNEDLKYIKYKDYIILGQGEEVVAINSKGEAEKLLKLSKSIDNFEIDSTSYIDIIDKKDNKITSIDSSGKTVFTDKVYQEALIYKSINKNTFVSVYKDENNEYVSIQDIEKNIIKEIKYDSKVSHVQSLGDKFIVIDLNTDKGIYSKLNLYDTKGESLKSCEFDEIVIDVICENNNIYLVFENRVDILDIELNKKSSVKINGIESIEKNTNGQIFVVDKNKNIVCIEKDNEKTIKSNVGVVSIEPFGEEYITYSEHEIFNKDNKEVVKLDDGIKDILYIGDNTIGVYVGGLIKVLRLS